MEILCNFIAAKGSFSFEALEAFFASAYKWSPSRFQEAIDDLLEVGSIYIDEDNNVHLG